MRHSVRGYQEDDSTWDLKSFELSYHHLPQLVELVLEGGIVLPLLDRLHLQLADGGLHTFDVFPQHRVLFFELSSLLPQLLQFELPGLVVVEERVRENRNVLVVVARRARAFVVHCRGGSA